MNIESLREFCLSLLGTTEDIKWEHLCFLIEEKIFIIIAIDDHCRFSVKCNPEEFDELVARPGIKQASHMAKRQWIEVENLEVLKEEELKQRIQDSRALILAKLPKKTQAKYQ
ncbi:MmcQ/YjbR family DNA-binding protein [Pedobacter montanisoli]|uniref:MmcQ/YjbR family DNA-binding protein n=1 Tax=Pedobacter montanisoli TaxID=2923277 RepID=A0ABS9ZW34_9SPHI|nr:MmcQ/YjbR family DNA-binding protein [Pedobacter montanisoli]MCJ0742516.1 MmcQ/YjbR family DNA-binding protein [Pedobacter montanisoli]